jgi:hypothetical protein
VKVQGFKGFKGSRVQGFDGLRNIGLRVYRSKGSGVQMFKGFRVGCNGFEGSRGQGFKGSRG